jgi:SAM-dependent methyltransferase
MEESSLYLMPNRDELARQRLDALGSLFDPVTQRRLSSVGLRAGWRCWEVGAGHSSLLRWLAGAVGPSGRVVATDIDPSGLGDDHEPWVDIRRGDVARDEPPQGPFDLVHARLVLAHVPERDRALQTMASVLAPGGVLVIEDADVALQPSASLDGTAEAALANRIRDSFRVLLTRRDAEISIGRSLPGRMAALGLSDIGADAWFPLVDPASERIERLTVTLLRNQLEDAGLLAAAEIDEHLANLEAGRVRVVQPPLIGCWGWRR